MADAPTPVEQLDEQLAEIAAPTPPDQASPEAERLQREGDTVDLVDELQKQKGLVTQLLTDQIGRRKTLHGLRIGFAVALFFLTLVWLFVVVVSVFMTGLGAPHFNQPCQEFWCFSFKLDNSVLIAFITSTTATVIGIFIIVAKWLYPIKPEVLESDKPKQEK